MTKLRVEAQAAAGKIAFSSEDLIQLYKLMYMYGWYQRYEPSYARAIEPELKKLLGKGIFYLEETFERWIAEHELPGWWETRFLDLGEDPFASAILYLEDPYRAGGIVNKGESLSWLFEHVNREKFIYDEFNNDMSYFESEALQFLQEKYPDNEDIQENMNESEAISYIDINSLHEDFKNYLINETGVFSADYFEDAYGGDLSKLLENPIIAEVIHTHGDEFIQWMYRKFITFFNLEPIIEDIEEALQYMKSTNVNDIPEAISAFNKGLSTAHYSGDMSEHFIEYMNNLGSNISRRLLDELSSGAYTKEWDYELRKAGIPIGARRRNYAF